MVTLPAGAQTHWHGNTACGLQGTLGKAVAVPKLEELGAVEKGMLRLCMWGCVVPPSWPGQGGLMSA